jgi:hypothetical protein
MELLEDFWFRDSHGKLWDAPKTSVVDGASIPRPLWALVGSPYTGDYRRASIVHDIACDQAGHDQVARKAADRMFFEACREGGCSPWDAMVLYVGVRIGAKWGAHHSVLDDQRVKIASDETDEQVRRDFLDVSQHVVSEGDTDDPHVVEERTERAFRRLAEKKAAIAALPLEDLRVT